MQIKHSGTMKRRTVLILTIAFALGVAWGFKVLPLYSGMVRPYKAAHLVEDTGALLLMGLLTTTWAAVGILLVKLTAWVADHL